MTDPQELLIEKNLLTHPDPFLWLMQVRIPSSPESMLRLTPNPVGVNFGTASDGTPIKWAPFPLSVGEIASDSEGGLSSVLVSTSAVSREITALLVQYRYLLDQEVKLHLVHRNYLSNPNSKKTFTFNVVGASADEESATFTLGARDLYKFKIPGRRLFPTCNNTYRDHRCRFTGDPGDVELGPCLKGFSNCLDRRAWEIANGAEVIHPGPFRGGIGIPRRI